MDNRLVLSNSCCLVGDFIKDLEEYHLDGLRFLFASFASSKKGAILNVDEDMNQELQVAIFLKAANDVKPQCSPVLVITTEEKSLQWHFYLEKYSGMDVSTLNTHNSEILFKRKEHFVILAMQSQLRILESYTSVEFSMVIVDNFCDVANSRVFKRLDGDFHIGLTHRNFYQNRDVKLLWHMFRWTGFENVLKFADFEKFDKECLGILVDPYSDHWLRLSWKNYQNSKQPTEEVRKAHTEKVKDWATKSHVLSLTPASKQKRKRDGDSNQTSPQKNKVQRRPLNVLSSPPWNLSDDEEMPASFSILFSRKRTPKKKTDGPKFDFCFNLGKDVVGGEGSKAKRRLDLDGSSTNLEESAGKHGTASGAFEDNGISDKDTVDQIEKINSIGFDEHTNNFEEVEGGGGDDKDHNRTNNIHQNSNIQSNPSKVTKQISNIRCVWENNLHATSIVGDKTFNHKNGVSEDLWDGSARQMVLEQSDNLVKATNICKIPVELSEDIFKHTESEKGSKQEEDHQDFPTDTINMLECNIDQSASKHETTSHVSGIANKTPKVCKKQTERFKNNQSGLSNSSPNQNKQRHFSNFASRMEQSPFHIEKQNESHKTNSNHSCMLNQSQEENSKHENVSQNRKFNNFSPLKYNKINQTEELNIIANSDPEDCETYSEDLFSFQNHTSCKRKVNAREACDDQNLVELVNIIEENVPDLYSSKVNFTNRKHDLEANVCLETTSFKHEKSNQIKNLLGNLKREKTPVKRKQYNTKKNTIEPQKTENKIVLDKPLATSTWQVEQNTELLSDPEERNENVEQCSTGFEKIFKQNATVATTKAKSSNVPTSTFNNRKSGQSNFLQNQLDKKKNNKRFENVKQNGRNIFKRHKTSDLEEFSRDFNDDLPKKMRKYKSDSVLAAYSRIDDEPVSDMYVVKTSTSNRQKSQNLIWGVFKGNNRRKLKGEVIRKRKTKHVHRNKKRHQSGVCETKSKRQNIQRSCKTMNAQEEFIERARKSLQIACATGIHEVIEDKDFLLKVDEDGNVWTRLGNISEDSSNMHKKRVKRIVSKPNQVVFNEEEEEIPLTYIVERTSEHSATSDESTPKRTRQARDQILKIRKFVNQEENISPTYVIERIPSSSPISKNKIFKINQEEISSSPTLETNSLKPQQTCDSAEEDNSILLDIIHNKTTESMVIDTQEQSKSCVSDLDRDDFTILTELIRSKPNKRSCI